MIHTKWDQEHVEQSDSTKEKICHITPMTIKYNYAHQVFASRLLANLHFANLRNEKKLYTIRSCKKRGRRTQGNIEKFTFKMCLFRIF